jgi:hypothetical protein
MATPKPAPKYGEHTYQVLHDLLGFSDDEIIHFEKCGAVSSSWSTQYIPQGDPRKYADPPMVIETALADGEAPTPASTLNRTKSWKEVSFECVVDQTLHFCTLDSADCKIPEL